MSQRSSSPRVVAMRTLRESLRGIGNGKYFVKRGAINWINFDFEARRYACAIMVDSSDVARDAPETDGFFQVAVSLEIATRIPPDDDPEINDDVLEGIYDDVERVLNELQVAVDARGDSVVFRLERGTATAIEWHDPQYRIQGLVVNFTIEF